MSHDHHIHFCVIYVIMILSKHSPFHNILWYAVISFIHETGLCKKRSKVIVMGHIISLHEDPMCTYFTVVILNIQCWSWYEEWKEFLQMYLWHYRELEHFKTFRRKLDIYAVQYMSIMKIICTHGYYVIYEINSTWYDRKFPYSRLWLPWDLSSPIPLVMARVWLYCPYYSVIKCNWQSEIMLRYL